MTLYGRCLKVLTSFQRPYNVVLTSCVHWFNFKLTLACFIVLYTNVYFRGISVFLAKMLVQFAHRSVGTKVSSTKLTLFFASTTTDTTTVWIQITCYFTFQMIRTVMIGTRTYLTVDNNVNFVLLIPCRS